MKHYIKNSTFILMSAGLIFFAGMMWLATDLVYRILFEGYVPSRARAYLAFGVVPLLPYFIWLIIKYQIISFSNYILLNSIGVVFNYKEGKKKFFWNTIKAIDYARNPRRMTIYFHDRLLNKDTEISLQTAALSPDDVEPAFAAAAEKYKFKWSVTEGKTNFP